MARRPQRIGGCLLAVMCGALSAAEPSAQGLQFFENKIRPALAQHCYKCHSAEAKSVKGSLYLDTSDGIRRGGDSGPAIVPGDASKSLLVSALRHEDFEMPPKGKLPDAVISDFAKWIEMGAPDPREGKGIVQCEIDLEKGRQFWCFQPVQSTQPPPAKNAAWSGTDIDRFIAAEHDKQGLKPVGEASPQVLIRRLYFDLIGLPPTREEVEQFEQAAVSDRQAAIEYLVDSLLDSPQFGERWGRHWLDVARYAESNGNSRNATFPHAWRYRDYVIDALNADTPYDRFVLEQIAGDLLPYDSSGERNRNLIATGFLALGSKPVIRGRQRGFIPDIAADQIEVTSRAILALTVACARCHDHKFDPIPTADYYGLAGIFASSETLYGGGGNSMGGAPTTPLHILVDGDPAKQEAYEQWQKELDRVTERQKQVTNQLKKLRPKKGKKKTQSAPQQKQLSELQKESKTLAAQLKKLNSTPAAQPKSAMGMRERDKVIEVPIYIRGESPKGDPIHRRLVTVATDLQPLEFPSDQSGRLELAQWLASAENPLTARVMVNRIWLHLFGEGLVRTPDNFGVNGDRPTHPELLDHLAATFVDDGWSVKQIIRQIVLTRAYQQSDAFDERNHEIDPDNLYLWRHSRRRLEAEAIRDSILAVSGQLDLQRPDGSVVSMHNGKLIQDTLTPDQIHRPSNHRSVYLAILRNGLPEALEVFDVADPSLVVGRRSVTTVPAQDLFLMNSQFVADHARRFAVRVLSDSDDDGRRIDAAYRLALARPPSETEKTQALQFITETIASLETDSAESETIAWAGLCQALFVSAEFRHLR